jgi:hypothetical protein
MPGEFAGAIEKAVRGRWSEERSWEWYRARRWPVGCNFTPSGAINQLEMWQAETFDPAQIDQELGWLAGIGMNMVRVFLHDLLWRDDAAGFLDRMEKFLALAGRHGIATLFVFFDSCWDPAPTFGKQKEPTPGVHNSGWVQSPGAAIISDPGTFDRLEDYVTRVTRHFRDDPRVLGWDVWNEPDNLNLGTYRRGELTRAELGEIVLPLVAQAFAWVRAAEPTQPLTSGVWDGDWSSEEAMSPIARLQVAASDVVSFHNYSTLDEVGTRVRQLQRYRRPLICSEYLARGAGNTFQAILPFFQAEKIGACNWGAVAGKIQTQYPWDSWQKKYETEPAVWHHDIFRPGGVPYDPAETDLIRSLTAT